jgi:hypothetical protein
LHCTTGPTATRSSASSRGTSRPDDRCCTWPRTAYDPRRPAESALAGHWLAAFARRAPGLRLRRNYPYRGRGDGLAALLRKRFPNAAYAGIELEVNQSFVAQGGAPWARLRSDLIDALADARTAARKQAPP